MFFFTSLRPLHINFLKLGMHWSYEVFVFNNEIIKFGLISDYRLCIVFYSKNLKNSPIMTHMPMAYLYPKPVIESECAPRLMGGLIIFLHNVYHFAELIKSLFMEI